jgi:hypothetical protein
MSTSGGVMGDSEPDTVDAVKSEEEAKPGAHRRQETATKLALFSRTVLATLILAAAGGIGAGLARVFIPSYASTGSATPSAAAPSITAPASTVPASAAQGVLPADAQISVANGRQQDLLSVPNQADSQDLGLSYCYNPGRFYCTKADAEPTASDNGNQQWQISSVQLSSDLYLATIASNFQGSFSLNSASLSSYTQYLSEMNSDNGGGIGDASQGSIGIVSVQGALAAGDPTGHQGSYWLLTRLTTGLWHVSPMVLPGLCLASSTGSPGSLSLSLQNCETNDDWAQQWTIGTVTAGGPASGT